MCFSATASFAACALLTTTGVATTLRARRLRLGAGRTLLATFPLFFGIQQGFEGVVWLVLEGALPASLLPAATGGFLFFAFVFWPVAGPLTGYLIETQPGRRRVFLPLIAAGVVLAVYLAWLAAIDPAPPAVRAEWGGHVGYLLGVEPITGVAWLYFVTAGGALLASSDRYAFLFGAALAASFAATFALVHLKALTSVWCFFAALCSLVIVASVCRPRDAAAALR